MRPADQAFKGNPRNLVQSERHAACAGLATIDEPRNRLVCIARQTRQLALTRLGFIQPLSKGLRCRASHREGEYFTVRVVSQEQTSQPVAFFDLL